MTDTDDTLARRYLTGSLTEEERAMFEERILTDPAQREDIELTHAMREGIRELAKRGELSALMSEQRTFWGRPIFGIAASVAAMVFAAISILLYTRADNSADGLVAFNSLAPPASRDVLHFELTRGGNSTPDVTWRRTPRPIFLDLELDVGIEPASDYAVSLEVLSGDTKTPILVFPSVSPGSHGFVLLSIHSNLLIAGDYGIRLEPRPAEVNGAQPMVYSLRIVD